MKEPNNTPPNKEDDNYAGLGIAFGSSFGLLAGVLLQGTIGTIAIALGLSFGTFLGILIGAFIKKKT